MIQELNFHADNLDTWADEHDCDDIPCPTYGDECPHDRASSLSLVAEELNLDTGPEWGQIVADRSYWITPCQEPDCEVEPDEEPEPERRSLGPWPKAPKLSRQAFNYLARVLAEGNFTRSQVEHVAYHLADTNPRFNRERFVEAASS